MAATDEKLRLGGMALRNGLLIHGPTHWAAAVRGRDGGDRSRLRAQAGAGARAWPRALPGLRGPLKLAEAMAVLPLVRRRLPAARLPFEDPRVLAAIGATLVATGAAAPAALAQLGPARGRWSRRSARCRPSSPSLDRDLAAYHGVEHKAIAAYEQGIDDPASVPKEHDRCGSNLIAPMMLLSAGGTVLLERLVEQPGPARPRRRRPRRRLDRGRDVRLERPPPRRAAGRGLPHARPRDPAPDLATKEPTAEQLEVGVAALAEILSRRERPHRLPPMFGRIDHIGVAVEDLDAALALYEKSFEMALAHRETVEEQGVEAVLLDVGEGHVELLAPLGPDTAGRQVPRHARAPGLHHVAYAVDDIDATLEQLAAAGIELIDSEAAGRHPREPRRLPAPALDRRRADRDRRTRGGGH